MRVALALVTSLVLAAPAAASTFRAPIDPPTIDPGCDYGSTDCAYPSHHTGIDYRGDDPPNEVVHATADGWVRVAATSDASHGFGNALILEHRLPDGEELFSLYGHLADPPSLRPGECVKRSASLGIQGDSGDTEDVSLHFELKRSPRFGPPYGYSQGWPDDYGYFDPKTFIGKRTARNVCGPRAVRCERTGSLSIERPRSGSELSDRSPRLAGRAARGGAAADCAVEIALRRRLDSGCAWWRPRARAVHARCDSRRWFKPTTVRADGEWHYDVPRALKAGLYRAYVRLQGQARRSVGFRLTD